VAAAASVLIVGGGPLGVELAGEICEVRVAGACVCVLMSCATRLARPQCLLPLCTCLAHTHTHARVRAGPAACASHARARQRPAAALAACEPGRGCAGVAGGQGLQGVCTHACGSSLGCGVRALVVSHSFSCAASSTDCLRPLQLVLPRPQVLLSDRVDVPASAAGCPFSGATKAGVALAADVVLVATGIRVNSALMRQHLAETLDAHGRIKVGACKHNCVLRVACCVLRVARVCRGGVGGGGGQGAGHRSWHIRMHTTHA
jgi:hypothetical protein